jgi:hypothetical protein
LRVPKPQLSVRLGGMLLIAALAACSGGSVATTPVPSPTTTPSSSQTVTTSTTSTTNVPATVAGGVSTVAVLPTTNNGASITESATVTPPGSIPVLNKARAAAAGLRTVQADVPSPILYLQFTTSTTTTLTGTPALTFTLPITAGVSYYLASYTSAGGWAFPVAGPGTVSSGSVTFAATTNSITISAAAPLTIALYSVPTAAPLTVTPTVVTFDATAPQPSATTLAVSQAGATAFTAAINCYVPTPAPTSTASQPPATPTPYPYPTITPSPNPSPTAVFIATLASTSATATSGAATFTVNGGNTVGQCIVTVTGASSQTATATINVDEASVGIFSTRRSAK